MKKLILRNFKLRKFSLVLYAVLILISPIFYYFYNPITGSFLYVVLTMFISYISIIESGQPFLLNIALGKNRTYAFNHSLPFSAKQQLNAHYLTTVFMSLFGAIVIYLYDKIPSGMSIGSEHIMSPMFFIAINLIGHALAFPRSSEQKNDYIPFILYVIVMNIILPVAYVATYVIIQLSMNHNVDSQQENWIVNSQVIILNIIAIPAFILTYLYQLKKIKQSNQVN